MIPARLTQTATTLMIHRILARRHPAAKRVIRQLSKLKIRVQMWKNARKVHQIRHTSR